MTQGPSRCHSKISPPKDCIEKPTALTYQSDASSLPKLPSLAIDAKATPPRTSLKPGSLCPSEPRSQNINHGNTSLPTSHHKQANPVFQTFSMPMIFQDYCFSHSTARSATNIPCVEARTEWRMQTLSPTGFRNPSRRHTLFPALVLVDSDENRRYSQKRRSVTFSRALMQEKRVVKRRSPTTIA